MAQESKRNGSSRSARDVMTANPSTVSQKDSIRDAASIMAKEDTGVVPVVDGRKVVGIVTDRDIVVRLVAEGKDPSTSKVSECMSKSVRSVKEDTPVDDVLALMSSAQVRRVPVINSNDELVGIISIGDISKESNEDNRVGDTIGQISAGRANN